MAELLVLGLTVAVIAAWLTAVVSAIRLVGRRAPGVSAWHLAIHGIGFFDPANFTPEAAADHRRFVMAFAAFFAGMPMLGASMMLLGPQSGP